MGTLNFLYVADFRKGRIRVYDANFQPIRMDDDDAFRDERIPRGFAPFNVQNIGGNLYVTLPSRTAKSTMRWTELAWDTSMSSHLPAVCCIVCNRVHGSMHRGA